MLSALGFLAVSMVGEFHSTVNGESFDQTKQGLGQMAAELGHPVTKACQSETKRSAGRSFHDLWELWSMQGKESFHLSSWGACVGADGGGGISVEKGKLGKKLGSNCKLWSNLTQTHKSLSIHYREGGCAEELS